ncbi:MAG: DnaJ domain-containing protein [Candidatus Methylomirabilales bacterium]
MPVLRRIVPILISLLYVLSPLDVMPDLLPGIGWMDDVLVIGALLWYLRSQQRGRIPWEVFGRMGGARAPRDLRPEDLTADFSRLDPYELLEVPRTASAEEIKAAYKRAVARYHPDKVAHLGKEFQELAHKKLLAIQQAYETLHGGRR